MGFGNLLAPRRGYFIQRLLFNPHLHPDGFDSLPAGPFPGSPGSEPLSSLSPSRERTRTSCAHCALKLQVVGNMNLGAAASRQSAAIRCDNSQRRSVHGTELTSTTLCRNHRTVSVSNRGAWLSVGIGARPGKPRFRSIGLRRQARRFENKLDSADAVHTKYQSQLLCVVGNRQSKKVW